MSEYVANNLDIIELLFKNISLLTTSCNVTMQIFLAQWQKQSIHFMKDLEVSEVALRTLLVCDLFFTSSSLAMALGSVNRHAEVHCTTIFALRSSKFSSRLGGEATHSIPTLKFRPLFR